MSSNTALDQFGQAVDASPSTYVDSYEIAGIDPDYSHLTSGGYHVPRRKLPQPWSDYSSGLRSASNSNPRDLGGSDDEACAIDMAFDDPDMVAVTQALIAAAQRGDPAMAAVREFNGTVDNRTTLNRDHELGWRQNYTPNASHLRHVHIGFYRDAAGDWDVIKGVVDIVTRASSGTTTQGGIAVPITSEEDDMYSDGDRDRDQETHDRVIATLPGLNNGRPTHYKMQGETAIPASRGEPDAQLNSVTDVIGANRIVTVLRMLAKAAGIADDKLDAILAEVTGPIVGADASDTTKASS